MTAEQDGQVAGIVLAAGAATRMGQLKQLLDYHGKTMVQHAVEQAREAEFRPLIVVVGAKADKVREALRGTTVEIVENSGWQSGMGSSIACGMQRMMELQPDARAVAIMLADQPLITADHYRNMRALLSENSLAVAAEYGGSIGVPAIFDRKMFDTLSAIDPEAGAKHVLREIKREVIAFPLPEAEADVDTPEDYAQVTS